MPFFTPVTRRREVPHGQGLITYEESNRLHVEGVSPHAAPDPVRYGATPSRPARRQVALMSTRTSDWDSGFANDFIPYAKTVIARLMPAGRVLSVRSQNQVGIRPNIGRPNAVVYGSLFELGSQTYDLVGG